MWAFVYLGFIPDVTGEVGVYLYRAFSLMTFIIMVPIIKLLESNAIIWYQRQKRTTKSWYQLPGLAQDDYQFF
jgi:5-bromo-4-chloroindolyl phosphate hydrolysis protein